MNATESDQAGQLLSKSIGENNQTALSNHDAGGRKMFLPPDFFISWTNCWVIKTNSFQFPWIHSWTASFATPASMMSEIKILIGSNKSTRAYAAMSLSINMQWRYWKHQCDPSLKKSAKITKWETQGHCWQKETSPFLSRVPLLLQWIVDNCIIIQTCLKIDVFQKTKSKFALASV